MPRDTRDRATRLSANQVPRGFILEGSCDLCVPGQDLSKSLWHELCSDLYEDAEFTEAKAISKLSNLRVAEILNEPNEDRSYRKDREGRFTGETSVEIL